MYERKLLKIIWMPMDLFMGAMFTFTAATFVLCTGEKYPELFIGGSKIMFLIGGMLITGAVMMFAAAIVTWGSGECIEEYENNHYGYKYPEKGSVADRILADDTSTQLRYYAAQNLRCGSAHTSDDEIMKEHYSGVEEIIVEMFPGVEFHKKDDENK